MQSPSNAGESKTVSKKTMFMVVCHPSLLAPSKCANVLLSFLPQDIIDAFIVTVIGSFRTYCRYLLWGVKSI